ncbi:MAG: DUF4595 domain-containing protein [Bacteroidaceae bacterium]|nr:DUF4595 domain-containing protein [Bacteroidaceae bacterium]
MKTISKYLSLYFMAVVCGMTFIACSDDDENDNGGSNGNGTPTASVGEVIPGSGKKLLSVDDYDFFYTPDGKIKYVVCGDYEKYEFTYSPNQIICNYAYDEDFEDKEVYTVSYNKLGYISKMHFTETGSDEYGSWNDSYTSTLSYDAEGHLVKVNSTFTEQGVEEGESYKESGIGTVALTWTNGLLKKYEAIEKYDDGSSEKEIISYEYENGENWNKYKQFASFMHGFYFYLGLFGNGPDYLPVRATETYIEEYEGEKYSDSDTEQFTYEFNEDGTLHRAGETFFKYGTIAEQGDVDKYKAKVTRAEKSRKRGYMFGLRHKNRRK